MAGKSNKKSMDSKREVRYEIVRCVPFQICPKCHGQRYVWFPPDQPYNETFPSSGEPFKCDLCGGAMVIPMAVIPDK